MKNFFRKTFDMYRDGFKSMTVGRTLWIVIAVKLAIIFLVVKLFFFPDKLGREYDNDAARADAVRSELINNNN